jgi:hypothetical protein
MSTLRKDHVERMALARRPLEGLPVGDALTETMPREWIARREGLP